MRFPAVFSSIKFRIVAACVVTGLAAALGAGSAVLNVTQAELQRQLLDNERSERERTAALLGSKLETLKVMLTAVARQVRAEQLGDVAAIGTFLLDKPALGALFDSVLAATPDGTMLARVERGRLTSELPNVADRDYFQAAMQGDQPVVSKPLFGRISKQPLVVIAAPVLDSTGRAIGIVAGSLRLTSTSLFADGGSSSEDGARAVVMDRAGVVLSHVNPQRILGQAADEPGLRAYVARWRDTGSPIDTAATAELDQSYLVSMAGIPLSDWALMRLTPRDVALAPMAAARRTALLAALVAAALACALAVGVAWAVARPIEQLRDQVERLLSGAEASADDWPEQQGEIGAMSRGFQLLLQTRDAQQGDIQAVMDNAEVGLALTREGRFEMVSRQFCTTFGIERDRLVGQSTRVIYTSDEAYDEFSARAQPSFMQHGLFDGEVTLKRGDGHTFWARMRGRAVVPGDRSRGTIWVIVDATADKDHRDKLSHAASHDRLTGLVNRAAFEAMLEEATAKAAEAPFCALFIDLDRFKHVNDTGGHAAGDALLRDVAHALTAQLRKSDTVARLGGDEFAVLLPQCPIPRSRELAEKLRAAVDGYRLSWEGKTYSVGASIGLVAVNGTHADAAEVLRAADAACYAAKRGGRNQVALAEA